MFNERWETYRLCKGVEVSKARYAKEAREEEKNEGTTERRENDLLSFKSE